LNSFENVHQPPFHISKYSPDVSYSRHGILTGQLLSSNHNIIDKSLKIDSSIADNISAVETKHQQISEAFIVCLL